MFSRNVYINRRNALKNKVGQGVILILGNNDTPMNYPSNTYRFRQDSSFLYFFGLNLPQLAGVIDCDSGEEFIFGNDIDIEDIIWMGPQPSMKQLAYDAGVEQVKPFHDLSEFIKKVVDTHRVLHFLPPYRSENKELMKSLTGIEPVFIKSYASEKLIRAVVALRSIKDSYEIEEIDKACAMGYQMHTTAMRMASHGIFEREIAGLIEGIALSNGGTVSFPVILSQNGETLHNHYHGNMLQDGRLMLTDAGAETERGYASDFTRTVPVSGKFTAKQKEIYDIVLEANNSVIEKARPGVTYLEMHLNAAGIITRRLKELGLMKGDTDTAVSKGAHTLFFPHGLGHMMGLDVHDMEDLGENYVGYDENVKRSDQFGTGYLRFARTLQKGYVVTVEPGIYFIPALIEKWKKENINHEFINFEKVDQYLEFGGIRIEDDILITDNGCRIIGKRIPATTAEIEEMMKK